MKFRPWSGLFLSEEYLSSVESANLITKEIIELYNQFNVEILIETALRTPAEVTNMINLIYGDDI